MIKMLLISFIGLILLTGCETAEEKQAKEIRIHLHKWTKSDKGI